MEVSKTPRLGQEHREMYEQAIRDNNVCRIASFELDTIIDNMTSMLFEIGLDELPGMIHDLDTVRSRYLKDIISQNAVDDYTDYNRIQSTATFARQRLLAPLAYGSEGPSAKTLRRMLSDGSEGLSINLLEEYLGILPDLDRLGLKVQVSNIRGAIQENSISALLNADQSDSRLCVTASTYDDIRNRTDLYLYRFDNKQMLSYQHQVSVKSTIKQKQEQLREFPDDIVIAAEEIGNLDLSISKLLVRRNNGSPGLTDSEQTRLRLAKDRALSIVTAQAIRAEQPTVPKIRTEFLGSLVELVA